MSRVSNGHENGPKALAMRDESRLVEEIGNCFHDPLKFVRFAFDWGHADLSAFQGPDANQTEILTSIAKGHTTGDSALRIAVASGHGVGKTTLVAWIILWFMSR